MSELRGTPRSADRSDAAAYVEKNVPTALVQETAAVVRERLLRPNRYGYAAEVAVLEEGRLLGVVRIEDLFAASPSATLAMLMDDDPPLITPGVDREQAAAKAADHGESSLAVVEPTGEFAGFIPAFRMLSVVMEEHAEDMARFGGYLEDRERARSASVEGLLQRFLHRIPWLLVGLLAAMAAAVLVARYEASLASNLALAFFIPGIVYIADAVGTQTETLVVRGLSLGVSVADVMRKELLTGLALGVALAALSLPITFWWVGPDIALAVSVSILAASTVAAGVAMALPWALSRTGRDPAYGSGPLATVIQDLLSIAIYLSVAMLLVG